MEQRSAPYWCFEYKPTKDLKENMFFFEPMDNLTLIEHEAERKNLI
jgi:hypothetical protein